MLKLTPAPQPPDIREVAQTAAEDMLRRMETTLASCEPIVPLLEAAGALPAGNDDATMERRSRIIDETFARVAESLLRSGHLANALVQAVERPEASKRSDTALANAIRTFYLTPQRQYTHAEVSALFSEDLANRALEMSDTCFEPKDTVTLSWMDVAYAVQTHIRAAELEDALGRDADLLPAGYRTEIVKLRLPRDAIDGLEEEAREHKQPDIAAVIEIEYGRGDDPIPPWQAKDRALPRDRDTVSEELSSDHA